MAGLDDLCLYAHVPFCETRCSFCEYTVVRREEAPGVGQYMDDLRRELALYRAVLGTESRRLHGFDIGGDYAGSVSAVMNTCGNIGGAISGPILAYLVGAYSWDSPFLVASALCVLAAALFANIDASRRIFTE